MSLNNPLTMLPQLQQNPAAFLQRMGIQIPQNMTDPKAIIDTLMQSGRFSQAQVNQAYQMMRGIRR